MPGISGSGRWSWVRRRAVVAAVPALLVASFVSPGRAAIPRIQIDYTATYHSGSQSYVGPALWEKKRSIGSIHLDVGAAGYTPDGGIFWAGDWSATDGLGNSLFGSWYGSVNSPLNDTDFSAQGSVTGGTGNYAGAWGSFGIDLHYFGGVKRSGPLSGRYTGSLSIQLGGY